MGKQNRRADVSDEEIIRHYQGTQSAYKTARDIGLSPKTVYWALEKHGIERAGLPVYRANAMMFKGQENEIRAAYDSGMTMKQLNEKFGPASTYAFKYAIKRAGGVLRENPAPEIKNGELDLIKKMTSTGIGQVTIALAMGRSQSFVSRAMRKHGILPRGEHGPARGKGHPMWNGGKFTDASGYVRVIVGDDDPMSSMRLHDSYVLEHRLVMARKLGRPLLRTETVHHIDGDRGNNHPDNLQLRQGKHGKHVVMCCLDCGSRNIGHSSI